MASSGKWNRIKWNQACAERANKPFENLFEEERAMTETTQQAQATPGEWDAFVPPVHGDPGIRKTGPHGEKVFVGTITDISDARLICASVNACRKAGYTVEELEDGDLQCDLDRAAKWDKTFVALQADRDGARAALAECREALAEFVCYEDDPQWRTGREIHANVTTDGNVTYREAMFEKARALLARLNVQE